MHFFLPFLFLATDLLYKDYHSDQKFTLTTYTSTGVVSFFPVLFSCVSFVSWGLFCVLGSGFLKFLVLLAFYGLVLG